MDTLRADHLEPYGYQLETTPRLRELAESAVLMEAATSQSSCTFSSVASILTGKYPGRIMASAGLRFGIPKGHSSLAEILGERGLSTFAVSASAVVRATGSRVNETGGFGEGFDVFHEDCELEPAECVTDAALSLASNARGPFLLYLHYMDPHAPYRTPPSHRRMLSPVPDDLATGGELRVFNRALYKHGQDPPATEKQLTDLKAAYDEEVRYWDGQFGRLMDGLESAGLLQNSAVVLTSDHGEDFLEHAFLGHCRTVYETSTHIPMLWWLPGRSHGMRVDTPVENVDIAATVLDLIGAPVPADLDGESLRPLLEGHRSNRGLVYASQLTRRSVSDGDFKLLLDLDSGSSSLHDLRTDREERIDVQEKYPGRYQALKEALERHIALTEPRKARASRQGMHQKLRQLGYLE